MGNEQLIGVYNEMHKAGVSSWFSDGKEERETILKMGEPWTGLKIVEIGCGEGDLCAAISLNVIRDERFTSVFGIDYSREAILKARVKWPGIIFENLDYKDPEFKGNRFNRIVMQGVLEHLDNPFTELKWMIDNLLVKGGDVITSSPCFLNPRGIVWMTLDMLGAVMSKTDLYFLGPKQIQLFCIVNGYKLSYTYCDFDWAGGEKMYQDLKQRIPLALRDGKIPYDQKKLDSLMLWLGDLHEDMKPEIGATCVYRIQT